MIARRLCRGGMPFRTGEMSGKAPVASHRRCRCDPAHKPSNTAVGPPTRYDRRRPLPRVDHQPIRGRRQSCTAALTIGRLQSRTTQSAA
jgi:hypothetical protein